MRGNEILAQMQGQRPKSKVIRQAAYLAALIESGGNKRVACRTSKVPESTVYRWFKKDRFFCYQWSETFALAHQEILISGLLRKKGSIFG